MNAKRGSTPGIVETITWVSVLPVSVRPSMLPAPFPITYGFFNNNAAFQLGGAGVFPGSAEQEYYYGISLGGVMGLFFSALTPDIERFGIDVPSINFSFLLQRSTQLIAFENILDGVGLTDPMDRVVGQGLFHELWVSAEPAGFARHITTDPLPGS